MREYVEKYIDFDTRTVSDLEVVRLGTTSGKPGETYRLSKQGCHTIFFVVSGNGTLHIDGLDYQLGSGDLFFVPEDISASYFAAKNDPWTYYWCSFTGRRAAGCSYAFAAISGDRYVMHEVDTDHYAQIIDDALDLPPGKISSYFRAKSVLLRLFADLSTEIFSDNIPRDNDSLAARARSIIDRDYSKKIQIQQIAGELGVHPYYISRVFKERYGMSPKQYLMSLKFSKASELLAATDIPISNISSSLGFEDQLAFSKAFRQRFGCSPTDYRKAHSIASHHTTKDGN